MCFVATSKCPYGYLYDCHVFSYYLVMPYQIVAKSMTIIQGMEYVTYGVDLDAIGFIHNLKRQKLVKVSKIQYHYSIPWQIKEISVAILIIAIRGKCHAYAYYN